MESTGMPNRIQLSKDTANLLIASGKSLWISPREDTVFAKGKGEMHTFWLLTDREGISRDPLPAERPSEALGPTSNQMKNDKTKRMIEWNYEVLLQLMRSIVAKRQESSASPQETTSCDCDLSQLEQEICDSGIPMDALVDVIKLPSYDSVACDKHIRKVVIEPLVEQQLLSFVEFAASMYRDVPFHCFEHATHVGMSTVKLLSRIVAPSRSMVNEYEYGIVQEDLHEHTYGIKSDPLTQFAIVFASLIHDVDHRCVPNSIMAKKKKIWQACIEEEVS